MSSRKKSEPERPGKVGLKLKKEERLYLRRLLSKGQIPVRVFKRARTLQLYDEGKSSPNCTEALGRGVETARRIAKRCLEGGLERALHGLPRSGVDRLLDAKQEAKAVAMDLFENTGRLCQMDNIAYCMRGHIVRNLRDGERRNNS